MHPFIQYSSPLITQLKYHLFSNPHSVWKSSLTISHGILSSSLSLRPITTGCAIIIDFGPLAEYEWATIHTTEWVIWGQATSIHLYEFDTVDQPCTNQIHLLCFAHGARSLAKICKVGLSPLSFSRISSHKPKEIKTRTMLSSTSRGKTHAQESKAASSPGPVKQHQIQAIYLFIPAPIGGHGARARYKALQPSSPNAETAYEGCRSVMVEMAYFATRRAFFLQLTNGFCLSIINPSMNHDPYLAQYDPWNSKNLPIPILCILFLYHS